MPRYCEAEQAQHGDCCATVVTIQRRDIMEPQTIEQCRAEIGEVDPSGRIVLNMEQVDNVSTGFITVLVVLSRAVRGNGGRVTLCNVQPRVNDVFKLLRLQKIMPTAETLEEALELVCAPAEG